MKFLFLIYHIRFRQNSSFLSTSITLFLKRVVNQNLGLGKYQFLFSKLQTHLSKMVIICTLYTTEKVKEVMMQKLIQIMHFHSVL